MINTNKLTPTLPPTANISVHKWLKENVDIKLYPPHELKSGMPQLKAWQEFLTTQDLIVF